MTTEASLLLLLHPHNDFPTNITPTQLTGGGGAGVQTERGVREVLEAIPFVEDGVDGGWFGRIGTSASLLLGTFGNLMTILILSRLRSGWSAMKVYLTSLALSDTAMLYTGTLPIWARKMLRYDLYSSHTIACKLGIWVMNSSAALSSWLLVALTLQRTASVVFPHRVNLICTHRKSIILILIIVLICFSLYAHTLFGYKLVQVGHNIRCTFGSAGYQQFWVRVWVRLDMFIYSLVPCIFLIASNAVLVWRLALAVQDAEHKLSAGGKTGGDLQRKKKASSATVTIIMVSSAFVLLTVPLMAYNSFFQDYAAQDQQSRAFHYFLYEFFFVVGLSNFAWNFYLYCLTGSKFRQEFVKIMLGCCQRRRLISESSGSGTELRQVQRKQNIDSHDDF